MNPGRHPHLNAGFTLLELMVVVIILSVLTAMIVPQFAGTYQAALLRGTARTLVSAVRLASSEAVTRNQMVRLVIDAEKRRYWMECREPTPGMASPRTSIQDVPGATGELHEKILVEVRSPRSRESRSPRARGSRSSAPGRGGGARTPMRGESIPFRPDGTTEAREIVLRDQEGFGLGLRIHPTTARVRTIVLEPEGRMRGAGAAAMELDGRMTP